MKKKVFLAIGIMVMLLIFGVITYVSVGTNKAENQMKLYLQDKGYDDAEIANIDVTHSFLNIVLSYNEWVITVKYVDEPDVNYIYTIKDDQIAVAGISGGIIDKEDLKHAE